MRETLRRRLDHLEEASKPVDERQRVFFQIIEADGCAAEILELIAETGKYVPFIGDTPPGILFKTIYEARPC